MRVKTAAIIVMLIAGMCSMISIGQAAAQALTPGTVGRLVTVTPSRVLDTAAGLGATAAPLAGQHTLVLQLTGRGGVPLGGVSTVLLELTATSSVSNGSIVAWPDGYPRPSTSALSFTSGSSVTNLLLAAVPADGRFDLYNTSSFTVQLTADVTGYVLGDPLSQTQTDYTTTAAGGYVPGIPTRQTNGPQTIPAGGSIPIIESNPAANQGVTAMAVEVTASNPPADGFLTLTPPVDGKFSLPVLSLEPNHRLSNTMLVPAHGPAPQLYNASSSPVSVLVDQLGSVTQTGTAAPSTMAMVTPAEVLYKSTTAHTALTADAGPSVPADATAVLADIGTDTGSSGNGSLIAWASGQPRPDTPIASFPSGVAAIEFGVIPLGADHKFQVYNNSGGPMRLRADIYGYLRGPGTVPAAVTDLHATASTNSIALTWTPPAGAAKVVVVRRPGTIAPAAVTDGRAISQNADSAVTDSGLLSGSAYSYAAFAIAADGGVSAAGSPVTISTTGATDIRSSTVGYLASTLDPAGVLGRSAGFDSSDGAGAGVLTTSELQVYGFDGAGNGIGLDLKPPAGTTLHAGFYPDVTASNAAVAGHATADYQLVGRQQDTEGDVEIRELAADDRGNVTRLDLAFREAPNGDGEFVYGEFRLGEPEPAGYTVSAREISIGPAAVGSAPVGVPIWIHDTGAAPVTVGVPATSGPEYTVTGNDCGDQVLQAGWTCSVTVGVTSGRPGPRTGTITIPVNGNLERVQLDSSAPPGRTELSYSAGGYIGGSGVDLPDNIAPMIVTGNGNRIGFMSRRDGDAWQVSVSAPAGQPITVGKRTTGGYGSTTGWGLTAVSPGEFCSITHGSIDVQQLALAADGRPLRADILFTQYCDNVADPMTGEIRYRLAADTSPPSPIASVVVSGTGATRTVSWANPCGGDYAYTAVRLYAGSVVSGPAQTGAAVYSGSGQSATVTGLRADQAYTVAAYPVDPTGNVGTPTVAVWTAAPATAKSSTCGYLASSRSGSAVYVNGLVKQWGTSSVVRSPHRTVYLQRYLNGSWQNLLSRITDSAGQVTVGFISPTVRQYRWCVVASTTAAATTTASAAR